MKNLLLSDRTATDIDAQVAKVLRGAGLTEPPVDLRVVRDLLKLDRGYYSTTDQGLLRDTFSKLKIAGVQVLKRPTLLADAVKALSLKALYLPDQKRILLDQDLPPLKHRWNEAHEIGHDIIPWHAGMMLGDTASTLTPSCHDAMEGEANYAAGQILFLGKSFAEHARAEAPSIQAVKRLSKAFGNTMTSTLWRYVEEVGVNRPMLALVSGHPHVLKRQADFNPAAPCRYFIRSRRFAERFGDIDEIALFATVQSYSGPQRGGVLGGADAIIRDANGERHVFRFETFFNGHEALTLSWWLQPAATSALVAV